MDRRRPEAAETNPLATDQVNRIRLEYTQVRIEGAEDRMKAPIMNPKSLNLRKVMKLDAMLEPGDTGARRRR